MVPSSNGIIFRVTGLLCGEFTGHRWTPCTKASDTELWCFIWFASWINGWVNNRGTGDLIRKALIMTVIVMIKTYLMFLVLVCMNDNGHLVVYFIKWTAKHNVTSLAVTSQWLLTHLPLDKMAAVSQTIFSDLFSSMKKKIFWLKFHWGLFLRSQLTIIQHWFK